MKSIGAYMVPPHDPSSARQTAAICPEAVEHTCASVRRDRTNITTTSTAAPGLKPLKSLMKKRFLNADRAGRAQLLFVPAMKYWRHCYRHYQYTVV
jgi:hypothetical protein